MNPEEYRRLSELEECHWWYQSLHQVVFGLIDRYLSPKGDTSHPLHILDAGCGSGRVTARLAAYGAAVGIDVSPHAAALWPEVHRTPRAARGVRGASSGQSMPQGIGAAACYNATPRDKAAHAAFLRASVCALPFSDGCFDLVVSLDVLYHRAVPDDRAAARELARVLRPGGLLLLNLPAYEFLRSTHDRAIHTARRYTRGRVRSLLLEAGLTPLHVGHWNSLLFPIAAAVRLWGRLRPPHEEAGSDVRPLPAWQNALLRGVLRLELAARRWWCFPFGLSVIAVARKPASEEASCARF